MDQSLHPRPPSLLIADDHEMVRELVAQYLAAEGAFQVTTAATVAAALDLVARTGGFDLVLLDLMMPGMTGFGGVRQMIAANARGRVLVFSGQAQREAVAEAMRLGAAGFIPKDLPLRSLTNALSAVLAGDFYLPAAHLAPAGDDQARALTGLTTRELDVLRGIRSGWMNKQIAHDLGLSEVTVKKHVRSICKKLNARNRTHAAMIANAVCPA